MSAVLPLRPRPSGAPSRGASPLALVSAVPGTPPLVVFDLDGTLIDTAPDLAASLNHCLAQAGLPESSLDDVRIDAGRGAQAMLRAAYRREAREPGAAELADQTARFLAYYRDHIAARSQPYPGAVAALDRLQRSGAILAVCTNKTEALALRLLDALTLSDRFTAICGADTFAGRKPDPAHLLGTIARAGGDPRAALMVGDSETDMEAARRIGIPALLVSFGYDAGPSVQQLADATIGHFDSLDTAVVSRLIEEAQAARPFAGRS